MAEETIKDKLKTIFKEYNYNKTYKEYEVVYNSTGEDTTFYVAKQNVPRKTAISNTNFWKKVTN